MYSKTELACTEAFPLVDSWNRNANQVRPNVSQRTRLYDKVQS